MTPEQAVREWIARWWGRDLRPEEITDVRFGVGAGWPGTDVTPGEPDFCCVRFRHAGEELELPLEGRSPVQVISECLQILEETVADPGRGDLVDLALRHVEGAHWGKSRTPPSPTVTREVAVRWIGDARTLAAEVRRLRPLAGVRHAARSSRARELLGRRASA